MPANVESMFSVREMPWHREGTLLADYPGDWDEARKLAGLDWDPVTTGVYAVNGVNPDGTLHYEPINGWKCIMRSDTEAVLSINKDSYTVIDHGEMGEIVEAVLAQPNVKWETAGVLDGGRAVWCLALLDEPVELPGDTGPTMPYLTITNRHDGTTACALRATAVRIVCANTFRAAELEGSAPAPPSRSSTRRPGGTGSRKLARPSPAPGLRCAGTPNLPTNCWASPSAPSSANCSSPISSPCHRKVW
jgi:phage/plasmid-like protein (TIGR03299 family)